MDTLSRSPASIEPLTTLSFQETARTRRSFRAFQDSPVPDELIWEILQDAQCTPSNCNTQPWDVHIVGGARLKQLSALLHEKNDEGTFTPDFSFDMGAFYGRYGEWKDAHSKANYEAANIARGDKEARRRYAARNYSFFNAPQIALLFMASFGDNVRTAGDIGMYGQTFLLSLAARGLGGIPQTSLSFFAGSIREFLDIPDTMKMLFGISFGYPDKDAPANKTHVGRVSIEEHVTFHF